MIRRAELMTRRDAVVLFGQSNAGPYGESLSAWPQRERLDPNWGLAALGQAGGVWQDASRNAISVGMLAVSLGAQMRYAGLRPSITAYWLGGNSAAQLFESMPTFAPLFAARIAELDSPRTVTLVWSQGESDWFNGTPELWRPNTEASITYMRTALARPSLRVVVVQLAKHYDPGPADTTYLEPVRTQQAALVAADPHASLVCVEDVATVNSNIHLGYRDLDRQARLIASDIAASGTTGV